MSIVFNSSDSHTIGIEVEVQLVDRESLELAPTSTKIIDGVEGLGDSVKHEFFMSNLEINTKVCSRIDEAENDLYNKFRIVSDEAARHDTILSCAGSHPFSPWRKQILTEDERYRRLAENLQIIARRFSIFGLHVHIGVDGGDKCIYIMNRMLYHLPHLLALSANSPFWDGEDTGLRSYRVKVFENLPTAGLPFFFDDWADYSSLVDSYVESGTIETIREIWWDIRPHPDFGTLEVRICDTPTSIKETLSIAAFVQSMIARFGRDYEEEIPYSRPHPSVIRQNKWRAARYGLDGEFIKEDESGTVNIRDAIRELIRSVEPEAGKLGSGKYISQIEEILEKGDGALRQLDVWENSGDLKKVVRYLLESLYDEIKSSAGAAI